MSSRRRRQKGDLYIKIDIEIPINAEEDQEISELTKEPEQEKTFFETVKDFI
jgi:DnaJ-class molecular chaperone